MIFARSEKGQLDCHDVFGGEQSDASCFVRHGGLRCCWSSSPWCWRVRLERRCRALGPGVQSWPATCSGGLFGLVSCPVRAAKGRLERAALCGSFLPWRRLSQRDERCAIRPIIARRIDVCNSSFAPLLWGVWSTSCFRTWYLQASVGRFADRWDGAGRRRSGRLFRWVWPPALLGSWATGIPLLLDGRGWCWPVAR